MGPEVVANIPGPVPIHEFYLCLLMVNGVEQILMTIPAVFNEGTNLRKPLVAFIAEDRLGRLLLPH